MKRNPMVRRAMGRCPVARNPYQMRTPVIRLEKTLNRILWCNSLLLLKQLPDDCVQAIVTDIPGTTRDTIEEWVEIDGFPVKLIDTAGITETEDPVESIGIKRTHQAL